MSVLWGQQRTLRQAVHFEGVGLHSGASVRLTVMPAPADTGRVFRRADGAAKTEIPALAENVVDTTLATTLGVGSVTIQTVEHLLGALQGLGVDNAFVDVFGPEVPALDGSSGAFVRAILEAGLTPQSSLRRVLRIKRPIVIEDGQTRVSLEPATNCSLACTIEFEHPLARHQEFEIDVDAERFEREIAQARTFGFAEDLERLRAEGFALGGSLDNAVLVDAYSVRNAEGLRYPNEFVRHKTLDALGDLALFGGPVQGSFKSVRGGHRSNVALVQRVLADERAHEWIRSEAPAADSNGFSVGDWAPV